MSRNKKKGGGRTCLETKTKFGSKNTCKCLYLRKTRSVPLIFNCIVVLTDKVRVVLDIFDSPFDQNTMAIHCYSIRHCLPCSTL